MSNQKYKNYNYLLNKNMKAYFFKHIFTFTLQKCFEISYMCRRVQIIILKGGIPYDYSKW